MWCVALFHARSAKGGAGKREPPGRIGARGWASPQGGKGQTTSAISPIALASLAVMYQSFGAFSRSSCTLTLEPSEMAR